MLETWCSLKQMAVLRSFLLEGLQSHLEENEFVRSNFGLGPPLDFSQPREKRSGSDRKMAQLRSAAQEKDRTQRLAKQRSQRDSRNAAMIFAED